MTADIKYTVKHHPRRIKKVATAVAVFGFVIIFLLDFAWGYFQWETLGVYLLIPTTFSAMNVIGFVSMAIGLGLRMLLKWRTGRIELRDDQLIIEGSYRVSIWLRNMWEVDFRAKWIIRLDSNVDALEIKFNTEEEFVDFSDKLIKLVAPIEHIKFSR